MTIQSGKGQTTTHSSQLLSVWNKMGVWEWVSDNILHLLCKNFSYVLHFYAWQQQWLTRLGWIATWQAFLQFFLTMVELKLASTSIFESLVIDFSKGFSDFLFLLFFLPEPLPAHPHPDPWYKVSKSRNCSSVVTLFSLCRQMTGRWGGCSFFFPLQNKELHILFHKCTGRNRKELLFKMRSCFV